MIKDPTTPQTHHYTLPCETASKIDLISKYND